MERTRNGNEGAECAAAEGLEGEMRQENNQEAEANAV